MSIGHTHKIFIITYIGTQTGEPKSLCIGTKCSPFIFVQNDRYFNTFPPLNESEGVKGKDLFFFLNFIEFSDTALL